MIVLSLQFPAGRFHGTPWGRHVNEGAVEWPPSPWRLLRALLATWHAKAPEIREDTVRRLLDRLAEVPPAFTLPPSSLGHTRHYLPFNEGRKELKTKVFDTFIHVPENERVLLHWDVELEPDLHGALTTLLSRLGYFGRAESLVEASLLDPTAGPIAPANAWPLREARGTEPTDEEIVRLLTPLSPAEYVAWRDGYLAAAGQTSPATPGPRAKAAGKKPRGPVLPSGLFEALHADTGALQGSGWALPPGARHLTYTRPARAFDLMPARRRAVPSPAHADGPTVARYAVASTVLPRFGAAVSVAERVHASLLSLSDGHPAFSGRDEDGVPARRNHRHAQVFCEPSAGRNAVAHLTVFARMGFDSRALSALRRLGKVWGHGGHDLQLVLLGVGQPPDFTGPGSGGDGSLILRSSYEWESLTPFVPTRHGKRGAGGAPKMDADGQQIGGPAHDLLRLLRQLHPEAEPTILEARDSAPTHPPLRWLQFQRRRTTGGGANAGSRGFGFRVRFAHEVAGPVAVGYGAHFGLGLFQPVTAGE